MGFFIGPPTCVGFSGRRDFMRRVFFLLAPDLLPFRCVSLSRPTRSPPQVSSPNTLPLIDWALAHGSPTLSVWMAVLEGTDGFELKRVLSTTF